MLSGCSSALPFYKPNPPQAENYFSLRIGKYKAHPPFVCAPSRDLNYPKYSADI